MLDLVVDRKHDDVLALREEYARAAQVDSQLRVYPFLVGAGAGDLEVVRAGRVRPDLGHRRRRRQLAVESDQEETVSRIAVGFIEAEGFVPIFDAVDAMTKATEVDVRGTPASAAAWSSVAVSGELATVEEAVEIGEETARAISGRNVKSIVFASPAEPILAIASRHHHPRELRNPWHPRERAIGIIETRGVVALTAGIEAMMKTADVRTSPSSG